MEDLKCSGVKMHYEVGSSCRSDGAASAGRIVNKTGLFLQLQYNAPLNRSIDTRIVFN